MSLILKEARSPLAATAHGNVSHRGRFLFSALASHRGEQPSPLILSVRVTRREVSGSPLLLNFQGRVPEHGRVLRSGYGTDRLPETGRGRRKTGTNCPPVSSFSSVGVGGWAFGQTGANHGGSAVWPHSQSCGWKSGLLMTPCGGVWGRACDALSIST